MKIAIDARLYHSSHAGIGRYCRALIRELANIDHENEYTIILTKKDREEYDIKNKNFKTIVVKFAHFTPSEQIKLYNILQRGKFDLVHFSNFNYPILYKEKFVITMHDLTMMLFPFGRQKSLIRQWAFRKVIKNGINNAAKIIAISQATKNDLVKHLYADPTKIEVVYEGVDAAYRQNSKLPSTTLGAGKTQNSKLWKNYNISNPYILFVSQWRPHKGLPELIKAFEILKKDEKNKNLKLVITGKPDKGFPEIPFAISHSPYARDIIPTGFVPDEDLPSIFAGAEVFVFPSHYEGFGLPPIEAMASGVPVVTSKASCMPEILGDAAVYFDPQNSADLADKINQMLIDTDLRNKMIKKGFEQVKKYSWRKMAEETLQIYKDVLE